MSSDSTLLPSRWYRVNNEMSPLHGCDCKLGGVAIQLMGEFWQRVDAVRRIDVFVGDRPYQRVSSDDRLGLGIMICATELVESPIQDEVVQLAGRGDKPNGELLWESISASKHAVRFQRSLQVAVYADDKSLAASNTWSGDEAELDALWETLSAIDDKDQLIAAVKRGTV